MPEALGDERWAAIRAVCEGALPTHERVALACGIYVKTISRRAGVEGWRCLDLRRPRVRTAHREMIEVAARAGAGEELDPVEDRFRALAADPFDDEKGPGGETGLREGGPGSASQGLAAMRDRALAPFEPLPELPPAERGARLRAMLTTRMEEMLRRAEDGRPVEGRQVAALAALAQLADRIAPAPGEEQLEDARARSDRVAELLAKIDERIFELSFALARELLQRAGFSEAEVDSFIQKGRAQAGEA